MAQQMYCDAEGCGSPASTLTTNLQTGDTVAYCDVHYVEFVVGTANAITEEYAKQHPEPIAADPPAADPENANGQPKRARRRQMAPKEAPEVALPADGTEGAHAGPDSDTGPR